MSVSSILENSRSGGNGGAASFVHPKVDASPTINNLPEAGKATLGGILYWGHFDFDGVRNKLIIIINVRRSDPYIHVNRHIESITISQKNII